MSVSRIRVFRTLNRNQRRFLIASIILLALGLTLLVSVGLPKLFDIYWHTPQCYIELDCKSDGFAYDMRNNTSHVGQLETMTHVYYDFQTPTIFSASNPIDYDISLNVDQSQYVKKAFLLIDVDDKMDIKVLNNQTYDNIKSLLSNSTIIPPYSQTPVLNLNYTLPNELTGKNVLYFWGVTGNVKLSLLIVDEKNNTHVSPEHAVFQVQSIPTLIQAEQNEQAKKSNEQVLALTWIGVALAPILIGADYLGRIFLD